MNIKKIFIWIISIFFLTGCSNISNKNLDNFDVKREKNYKNLYENWQLEKLQIELSEEKDENLILKYKKLIEERQRDKVSLQNLISEIKADVVDGNVEKLKTALDSSLENIFVGDEIEKIDFSQMKIFINKPKFFKNSAQSLLALVVEDRTIYFDVYFSLKDGKWKITKFKERR